MTDSNQPLHLGRPSRLPASPDEAILDYVVNPRPGRTYLVRFAVPEFTSLCPVTGQPDFAHLVIDYVPGETIVESKSLKLFLGAFRNHAAFHEDCTVGIGERLVRKCGRAGCGSVDTGIRAGAFRSTYSGKRRRRPPSYGCRIRVSRPIEDGADLSLFAIALPQLVAMQHPCNHLSN